VAGSGDLAANGVTQAEAVAVASNAMHLGQVRAGLVGERIAEGAAP
jgi:hypothetical protein